MLTRKEGGSIKTQCSSSLYPPGSRAVPETAAESQHQLASIPALSPRGPISVSIMLVPPPPVASAPCLAARAAWGRFCVSQPETSILHRPHASHVVLSHYFKD